jgi:hypothetical protein
MIGYFGPNASTAQPCSAFTPALRKHGRGPAAGVRPTPLAAQHPAPRLGRNLGLGQEFHFPPGPKVASLATG